MNTFEKYINDFHKVGSVSGIRPKVIFKFIEDTYKVPVNMNFYIPSSEIGSLTVLECSILISLLKVFNPKNIFEFGTFLGYSTALFMKNSDVNSRVFSIDLGNDIENYEINKNKILSDDIINDNYLKTIQSKMGPMYLYGENLEKNERLKLLYGDSRNMKVKELGLDRNIQFVFVDGGHSFDIIKSDTEKSQNMVDQGIIVWHDYNSKIHQDVTLFLNERCANRKIFHVENTMLAFEIISKNE